jgi:FkbM family methyltransferase
MRYIKLLLKKLGVIVKRYPEMDIVRRMKLVDDAKISILLDVGANSGQYSSNMRDYGYNGRIISFEPLSVAFKLLSKISMNDKKWEIYNFALGNNNIDSIINIAGNSWSSSILNMLQTHLDSAPESSYVSRESIVIKTLDSLFEELCGDCDNVMLKMDVQGFEKEVLEGSINSLSRIKMIQLEMSIIELYEGEMLLGNMIEYLSVKGFQLVSLENGYFDSSSGHLFQVDGIFLNTRLI